jgi:hypothetical protein
VSPPDVAGGLARALADVLPPGVAVTARGGRALQMSSERGTEVYSMLTPLVTPAVVKDFAIEALSQLRRFVERATGEPWPAGPIPGYAEPGRVTVDGDELRIWFGRDSTGPVLTLPPIPLRPGGRR